MRSRLLPLLLIVTLAPTSVLFACLWDQDTLRMELVDFPDTLELITGKFRRHSDDYYRWRIEDRTAQLPADPSGWTAAHHSLLDDLAVAHDKLGDSKRAIEIADRQLEISPDRYESLANRGTFYLHDDDLVSGLRDLHRAIEVNPDAHFGREIVQIRLVEYLIAERAEGRGQLPLTEPLYRRATPHGFDAFRETLQPPLSRADALTGLLGMLRFGNHDSPLLLDVVAELLYLEDHKRLATRAYLKASYETKDEALAKKYRAHATEALSMQTPAPGDYTDLPLADLERKFQKEIQAADAFFSGLTENERRWIAAGEDVDARFAETYFGAAPPAKSSGAIGSLFLALGGLAVVGFLLRKG